MTFVDRPYKKLQLQFHNLSWLDYIPSVPATMSSDVLMMVICVQVSNTSTSTLAQLYTPTTEREGYWVALSV